MRALQAAPCRLAVCGRSDQERMTKPIGRQAVSHDLPICLTLEEGSCFWVPSQQGHMLRDAPVMRIPLCAILEPSF